jgi:hypothetical protein
MIWGIRTMLSYLVFAYRIVIDTRTVVFPPESQLNIKRNVNFSDRCVHLFYNQNLVSIGSCKDSRSVGYTRYLWISFPSRGGRAHAA